MSAVPGELIRAIKNGNFDVLQDELDRGCYMYDLCIITCHSARQLSYTDILARLTS